jgi:hypothetical protein
MVDVEELTEVFPEVEIEKLGTIHEGLDHPSRRNVAQVLESAKTRGKVPEADYLARIDGATQPRLHPEFRRELEKEGLDPEKAEDGLQAEQEVEYENWTGEAIETAENADFAGLIDFYADLDDRCVEVLQSPMRETLPDDLDEAAGIVTAAVESRIDQAAYEEREADLEAMRQHVTSIPTADAREAFQDKIQSWLLLLDNDGTEAEDARQWVWEADSVEGLQDRLYRLRTERPWDVTPSQVKQIMDGVRDEMGV